ncbi:MAG: leucyl/phenylalanyl-tRNA--protein transferase [Lacibacter sp.]
MPLHLLDDVLWFPPLSEALPDGLLAMGGDLKPERLLLAYRSGIFPWFNADEPPLWWSPDPRCVLFPPEVHISHSMRSLLRRNAFTITTNRAFEAVITQCGSNRTEGTWITPAIIQAYTQLHNMGYAHSVEAWQNHTLVGGLYGIRIGNIFFGESMFSNVSNASKYAFIHYMKQLQQEGVVLVDCQVHNPHLESLGARMIPREEFIQYLNRYC